MNKEEMKVVKQYVGDMVTITDDTVGEYGTDEEKADWLKDRAILEKFISDVTVTEANGKVLIKLSREAAEEVHNFITGSLMVTNDSPHTEELMCQLSDIVEEGK